jgi:hypothetical protein
MARTRKRIVLIVGSAMLVIAALVVAMFAFGKPMTPQASSQAAPPGVAATQAPAGAPEGGSDPLAVEIPGCVCHSDDPAVVAEHATYRMSQCFDCHSNGMPEMGQ